MRTRTVPSASPPRMQGLRDDFFYGSGSRPVADDERQLLAKEQKLCRVRSRRFSVETNQRMEALEERRRVWDEQELRLRENLLQQRRQRVQDATERFQRAHLPPSQRRRQAFRRNIPNIEDALSQIQGSLTSRSRQSSFSCGGIHVSRRAASPRPPAVPKSSSRRALSAAEAYTKLLQEQTCMRNAQEPEKESHMSDSCNSEILSSKDSLEIEDLNPQNDPYPKPDLASSTTEHGESDQNYASKSSWEFTSPKMAARSSVSNILTFCQFISGGPEHFDVTSPQTDASHNVIGTNGVSPSNVALETFCPNQEALLDLRQHKAGGDRQLKHPSVTEILLPAENGNAGSPPKPNTFRSDNTIYNVSHEGALLQIGKENQKEPGASINNLNKGSAPASKSEKPVAAGLQPAPESNIQSEARKLPVRFIKGILKYPSKYVSGDTTCAYGSVRFIFTEQVASRIRDSVEMTRAKMKQAEAKETVRKKLRWLDEVHEEDEEQEDHQPRVTTVSGASTGYHFTKHAWADVGVQTSHAGEVPPSRVPRREPPGAGPVPSRTRKGAAVRPQSAAEASRITAAQGKLIVPRPPPRTEAKAARVPKTPYAVDQLPRGDNNEGPPSPHAPHGVRADGCVTYPEASAKASPGSAPQEGHDGRRRMSDKKGFWLNRTPTNEEISELWHDVRSALATKEAEFGRQAPESGRVVRHSRNPPASGSRRLPQPSQAPHPVPPLSRILDVLPHAGLQSAAHVHAGHEAATDAAQRQRSTRGLQGPTAIYLEEQKILLSLDRLNHRLHCVQDQGGGRRRPT